jgi:hypothetical protein
LISHPARCRADPAYGAGFKTLAENIVESLAKGDRVLVDGTVTTEAWTDKQSGGEADRATGLASAGETVMVSWSSGSSWSPTAVLTVNAQPGPGRTITGTLTVQTDAGVTVCSGSLVVNSVTSP